MVGITRTAALLTLLACAGPRPPVYRPVAPVPGQVAERFRQECGYERGTWVADEATALCMARVLGLDADADYHTRIMSNERHFSIESYVFVLCPTSATVHFVLIDRNTGEMNHGADVLGSATTDPAYGMCRGAFRRSPRAADRRHERLKRALSGE